VTIGGIVLMRRLSLALVATLATALAASEAHATAGIVCEALDKSEAFVEMNLPRTPGIDPNWVMISTPGRDFSTKGAEDGVTALSILQSFEDESSFAVDLSEDMLNPAVKLRLLIAEEGDELPIYIGYLQVVGQGVYPISCIEDE
jgi:hypothetical protein